MDKEAGWKFQWQHPIQNIPCLNELVLQNQYVQGYEISESTLFRFPIVMQNNGIAFCDPVSAENRLCRCTNYKVHQIVLPGFVSP